MLCNLDQERSVMVHCIFLRTCACVFVVNDANDVDVDDDRDRFAVLCVCVCVWGTRCNNKREERRHKKERERFENKHRNEWRTWKWCEYCEWMGEDTFETTSTIRQHRNVQDVDPIDPNRICILAHLCVRLGESFKWNEWMYSIFGVNRVKTSGNFPQFFSAPDSITHLERLNVATCWMRNCWSAETSSALVPDTMLDYEVHPAVHWHRRMVLGRPDSISPAKNETLRMNLLVFAV